MTFSDIVNLCVRQLQGDKVEAYMKRPISEDLNRYSTGERLRSSTMQNTDKSLEEIIKDDYPQEEYNCTNIDDSYPSLFSK